jgi:F0F1-type ATP synthase assembly protein I
MVLYGGLGWLADRWLGTGFLAVTGIVVGGVLGLWLTVLRFTRSDHHQDG